MKLLGKSLFVILFCLLIGYTPIYGQNIGELRYNTDLHRIEIFLNTDLKVINDSSSALSMGYEKIQGWYGFDSLRQASSDGYFYYGEGAFDLNSIEYYRKMFNVFRKESIDKNVH